MSNEDLAKLKIDRSKKLEATSSPRRRLGRFRLPAFLVLTALAAYWAYEQVASSGIAVDVGTVTTTYPSQAYTLLTATGYVVAQRKADVASKATGRLQWIEVEAGSRVTKNETLARLENEDLVAEMNRAKANVEVARAGLREAEAELGDAGLAWGRARDLINKRFISQESHDAAAARYRKARAAVARAKAAIDAAAAAHEATRVAVEYTLIRAPFDGVVTVKNANIGDVVAPFSAQTQSKGAVVSMVDMDTLEVEADVSESNLQKVKPRQPCEVQLDALPETRLRGVVHTIVPTVDRTKATVLAKIRFLDTDGRILPEMSAKVAFLSKALTPGEQQAVTVVPSSAIVSRDRRSTVFVVRGNHAAQVTIEAGDSMGEWVVVKNGVSPGDKVVINAPEGLRDGAAVKLPDT